VRGVSYYTSFCSFWRIAKNTHFITFFRYSRINWAVAEAACLAQSALTSTALNIPGALVSRKAGVGIWRMNMKIPAFPDLPFPQFNHLTENKNFQGFGSLPSKLKLPNNIQ
jgi:hypothetical protein